MLAVLEVRRAQGTTFYPLEGDNWELAKKWKAIDCGCAAYAQARAALWPSMLEMIAQLQPINSPVSPNTEVIKVIA